jgi:hypothetical protein
MLVSFEPGLGRLTSAHQLALIFTPTTFWELVIIGRGFPSISICKEVIMAATVGPEVMVRETARLIASDKIEGTAVRRSNGDKLGTVQRVMIDKRSGKVAYAVITLEASSALATNIALCCGACRVTTNVSTPTSSTSRKISFAMHLCLRPDGIPA